MSCETTRAHLDDYLDGGLPEPARAAFEAHVETCETCAAALGVARSLARALEAYPLALPDAGFEPRVLERARTKRPMAPRGVALAFIAAFAATILTIIFTGLLVEAPRTELAAGLPTVAMVVDQTREVNLVFASSAAVEHVSMIITLPEGVELLGHEGEEEVRWTTQLAAGNNILPLTLVASEPTAGQIVARLQRGGREKVFRVHVTVDAAEKSTG